MRLARTTSLWLMAVIVGGCSVRPAPARVEGSPNDLQLLVGEWKGSYEGDQGDCRGEILFELRAADADSAYGYVLMETIRKPQIVGYKSSRGFWRERSGASPNRLTFSFFRAEDGGVRATLNRYPDPECGCTLHTTFLGKIGRDSIIGTFETRHIESGTTQKGTWAVSRQG